MSRLEDIQAALLHAMKQKDSATVAVLRLLSASIKNKQLDAGKELTDEEVLQVILTQVKQTKDARKDFETAGRDDLLESNDQELAVLSQFLPKQLSDDELKATVMDVKNGLGESVAFGQLMGEVMKQVKGQADGDRVRTAVQEVLGA